jgi:hypothetical protein
MAGVGYRPSVTQEGGYSQGTGKKAQERAQNGRSWFQFGAQSETRVGVKAQPGKCELIGE